MKKKHGLVATAWMLSGTWMFNTSMTAEAQIVVPPANSSAPRAAFESSTNAPRLLPDMLRNSNQTTNGAVARPIMPAATATTSSNPSGFQMPPRATSAVRMSVQPAQYNGVAPQSVNNAPSAVQQQLEELYRRDGRQMPAMNLQQMPIQQIPTNNAPQGASPNTLANSQVAPARPAPKSGFFSKLNPFKSKQAAAPMPPQQRPGQAMNGAAVRQPNGQSFNQQQQPSPMPAVAPNQFNNPANATVNSQPAPRALPTITPAPSTAAAVNAAVTSKLLPTLPPIPGDPDYKEPVKELLDAAAKPSEAVDEALKNAFSDMPDDNAEKKAEATSPESENPFSGLSLDDPSEVVTTKPAETKQPINASETKPAADAPRETKTAEAKPIEANSIEAKPIGDAKVETPAELSLDDELPIPTEPAKLDSGDETKKVETKTVEKKADEQPAADDVESKMKRISERGDLRGLKGFCPVALRDQRDLKNALPEHTSTFKGRTYYFSSAAAKEAFDQEPDNYAPVSGGIDIVLHKQKVTKEGSLDHAVWYRNRLYLFTSQKTLEQFVATPIEFASIE